MRKQELLEIVVVTRDELRKFGALEVRGEAIGQGPVSYTHLTLPTICSV